MSWLLGNWMASIYVLALIFCCGASWHLRGEIDAAKADKLALERQEAAIEQQNKVIGIERHATDINNQTESDYAKNLGSINDAYAGMLNSLQSYPAAANGNLPAVSPATGRAGAAPVASAAYHLTFRQCDVEEAKLISLWNDWKAQAASY